MISGTGFWNIEGSKFEDEHCYDRSISQSIVDFALEKNVKKAYDFGCGSGKYTRHLRDLSIESTGFDGNPITSSISFCKVQDLTSETFSEEPVDFLLCLEVCEHVPKEFEAILVANIDKHLNQNGTLVLSWAVKDQVGFGHVNCQNNDYVIKLFESKGYSYSESISNAIRSKTTNAHWFRDTIMVFNKCLSS